MYKSLSARRAWIEIDMSEEMKKTLASLSARRAWIEIVTSRINLCHKLVALRKESVDRNDAIDDLLLQGMNVALRKESVDRNLRIQRLCVFPLVALRKESVDRNSYLLL